VRGASAIQDVLSENARAAVRVLIVWEPVIVTDVAMPTSSTLARVHDARAAQFWDQDRALSGDIIRSVMADPDRYSLPDEVDEKTVVWDVVAVFPPGATWDRDIPKPSFYGSPVVDAIDGLGPAIRGAKSSPPN